MPNDRLHKHVTRFSLCIYTLLTQILTHMSQRIEILQKILHKYDRAKTHENILNQRHILVGQMIRVLSNLLSSKYRRYNNSQNYKWTFLNFGGY